MFSRFILVACVSFLPFKYWCPRGKEQTLTYLCAPQSLAHCLALCISSINDQLVEVTAVSQAFKTGTEDIAIVGEGTRIFCLRHFWPGKCFVPEGHLANIFISIIPTLVNLHWESIFWSTFYYAHLIPCSFSYIAQLNPYSYVGANDYAQICR